MLPFFRKIRWRLAQDNQFLKYSRYAIGEVVLVVIGILIALQINNMNEERKLKDDLKTHLNGLVKDIENDIGNLEDLKRWSIIRYNSMQAILIHIGQKENSQNYANMPDWVKYTWGYTSVPKTLDIKFLSNALQATAQMTHHTSTKNALDQLKNSGLLSFIDNKETITEMDNYYDEFEFGLGQKEWESLLYYKQYWLSSLTDNGFNLEGVNNTEDLLEWLEEDPKSISALRNLITNAEWTYYNCGNTINKGKYLIDLINQTKLDL